MNSSEFLMEMYPDKPEDSYILIWRKKQSRWYKNIEEAASYIQKNPDDTYYGVGLSPQDYGMHKRCKADKIYAMPGLYADIDVGKKNYPPNVDEAINLIHGNGFDPTMVVSSGYGIHAYWLFKELMVFGDDELEYETRDEAAEVNRRINLFLIEQASKKGWTLDNVSDLARILRPVGSINCKNNQKIPVTLLSKNGIRYQDLSTFDDFIPEIGPYGITGKMEVSQEELDKIRELITFKKIAEPPQQKLDMLIDADPHFKDAWQHVKSKKKDTTRSGFHFTLCILSAKAGWTDQEITDMMIAWNRRHGFPLDNVMRPDYVTRTIAKARKTAGGEIAEEYLAEISDLKGTEYEKAQKESLKKKSLEAMSHLLGFKIYRFIKYVMDKDPEYRWITSKGDVYFNSPDDIMMLNKFQARIVAHLNMALNMDKKVFGRIKECYEHVIEEIYVSEDSVLENRMNAWIIEYLDGQPHKNQHEAANNDSPFVYKGNWYLFSTKLREWAFRNKHFEGSIKRLTRDMKIVGCEQKHFNPDHPRKKNERIKKKPWMIPTDIISPEDTKYLPTEVNDDDEDNIIEFIKNESK